MTTKTDKEAKKKATKKAAKTATKKAAPKKATKKAAAASGEIQKLRIRVRAYEHKILDASVKQIMDTALRYDAKVVGTNPTSNGDKEVHR